MLTLTAAAVVTILPAAGALPAGNVVVNGGFDTNDISGWTTFTGAPDPLPYGEPGGWPTASDPGPPDRATHFYWGGNVPYSRIDQVIHLSAHGAEIDAGAAYQATAWLGGWEHHNDQARVTVIFRDAANSALGVFELGPVSASERGSVTMLIEKTAGGTVPVGTRSVFLVLDTTRFEGSSNDGYADSLSLSLAATPVPVPELSTGVLTLAALGLVGAIVVAGRHRRS